MKAPRKHIVIAVMTLAVALVAGGKKGQDTIQPPRPSLNDDYLLSALPKEILRVDSSRLAFAEGEITDNLFEVTPYEAHPTWMALPMVSQFVLDAYRGAPALLLEKDFYLPLEAGLSDDSQAVSLVLVSRKEGETDMKIHLLGFTKEGTQWTPNLVYSMPTSSDEAESPVRVGQVKSKTYVYVPKGVLLAEAILLDQPLSQMQVINISDSLFKKWIDHKGL